MVVVYLSLTGNIRRFVNKLERDKTLELNQSDTLVKVDEDFVLIVPSYSDTLTERVYDFLDYKNNKKFLVSVIGSGEKNFNKQYVFSAKDIAKKYNVPLSFDFEKSGTETDIENFKKDVLRY